MTPNQLKSHRSSLCAVFHTCTVPDLSNIISGKALLQSPFALINSAANEAILEYEKTGEDVPAIHSATLHPKDSAKDSLVLKKAVRLLEGACQQLCASLAPPQHTVTNVNFAQLYDGACVRAVIRADITSILANHPEGLYVRNLSSIVKIDEAKLGLISRRSDALKMKTDVFANNRLSLKLDSSEDITILTSMHTEFPKAPLFSTSVLQIRSPHSQTIQSMLLSCAPLRTLVSDLVQSDVRTPHTPLIIMLKEDAPPATNAGSSFSLASFRLLLSAGSLGDTTAP
ncbi:hypothetical protein BV22DRAFT_1131512 [Leucogyrophana mollusca]|uniref:Uncharacterized protein n=1 Tax=Leucogyrophana mollusca TaxID=85980 RepID=A0ACB8BC16_9AGAM|nr:hypothetical protein BV22DRAFT_1131512 [Leucogyrophana mollusca]